MGGLSNKVMAAITKSGKFGDGDSFKIRHTEDRNGFVCTPSDKDPAMVVTRSGNGWLYYCHRCQTSGFITDGSLTPEQTVEKMKHKNNGDFKEWKKLDLPYDTEPLGEKHFEGSVAPVAAYAWLRKYNLEPKTWIRYGFGWSRFYQRLIMPVYGNGELLAWCGRNVWANDPTFSKYKIPKYILHTKEGARRYFKTNGNPFYYIVCEDIISAIKTAMFTGGTGIALLNSSIGDDLIREMKGCTAYVWLDPDKRADSVRFVNRMNQFGVRAKHVTSDKDPKDYDELYVQDMLRSDAWHQ